MPTILIVDDEPMIRKLLRFALEREGFRVLTAENGIEAIRVSTRHPGEIDILLSDVLMPGMDGPTLASRLLATDPKLPVLLMSGCYQNLPATSEANYRFLPKPFSIGGLMSAIRSVMRGARSAAGGSSQLSI
jgi:two-component system cell cycle sensor histidine kinase/response regulator CckA